MSDLLLDDPTVDLQRELGVEPSAGFVHRIRAHALTPRPTRSWARWIGLSLAAASVATIALLVRPGERSIPDGTTPAPDPPVASLPNVRPAVPAQVRQTVTPATRRVRIHAPTLAESGSGLVVITSQPEMLRRLWAGVYEAVDVSTKAAPAPTGIAADIVVPRVVVDPVIVLPFDRQADPLAKPGAPVIRRVTAEDASRSPQ